jgi:hypothetical protein
MTRPKNDREVISFVLTHGDYYKIDGLITALGLAIAEIIATKQVMEKPYPDRQAQWDCEEKLNAIIDTTDIL